MTAYVHWLRQHIGHAKTPLVYASTIIADRRGALLFQRRADFGDAWWGLPGGLLELGENITECAIRETREETGLNVQPIRLVGLYTSPDFDVTYPNGDEAQQVTACFAARVTGGELRVQAGEIEELRFFAPDALPPMPPWYAAMVSDFLAGRPEASFRSGSPSAPIDGAGHTFLSLRRIIGSEHLLIFAGASAVIRDGDQVLLHRRGDNGMWGVPGGGMELGERIDQTAVREAREETGLEVEVVRLTGVYSDPKWRMTYPHGDSAQVFIANFECRVTGGALHIDGVETIDLRWSPLDALPDDLPERHRVRVEDALAGKREAIVR
jgi:ADP-ribose pyrophosphatase YjhB (NUDIX family)